MIGSYLIQFQKSRYYNAELYRYLLKTNFFSFSYAVSAINDNQLKITVIKKYLSSSSGLHWILSTPLSERG